LHDVPDEAVIDIGVTMNENVAKRDDASMVADSGCDIWSSLANWPSASPMISNCRYVAALSKASA
jgi:hypothetical protein